MPKQSKITCSKPGNAAPVKDAPERYFCCRCERNFTKQKTNFPASQSPMYKGNGGYLPVCRHCVDEMFEHYKTVFGDEMAAIKRICMKFDIYWNEKIYDMLYKANTSSSRVLSYISKSNLYQYVGKTFDDTLDEEYAEEVERKKLDEESVYSPVLDEESCELPDSPPTVSKETISFWGGGFTPAFYYELDHRYNEWASNYTDGMSVSDRAVIKQICILEATINKDAAAGKSIDKAVNALNTILGSANLKPVQKTKDTGADSAVENTPFGVWIRKIENTEPIPEPDPEFKDVDGIIKYISIWFFGHLCKMLKIENRYSHLYEEEMERLRVDRPEYEGEDDEAVFDDIFSRAGGDDE